MKVAEVADLLQISRMTVYRMVKAGELPAVRFGAGEKKYFRIPAAAVAAYLTASWVGEVPDGYKLTDLLGESGGESSDGDVVQLPERRADQ